MTVAVLGGGPAGSACALSLRALDPGRRVVIFERGNYGATRRIGETLPPSTSVLLRRLGVWGRIRASSEVAPAHGTAAAWGSSDLLDHEFVFSPLGHGLRLDRTWFDRMLARCAVDRGAELRTGVVPRVEDLGDGRRVDGLDVEFVVDATGRTGAFARKQGAKRSVEDHLVAVHRFTEGRMRDTRTVVEAVEHGWWYSASLPEGGAVVAFMTDSDLARDGGLRAEKTWEVALARTTHTRARDLGSFVTPPLLAAAAAGRLDRVCGPGWLAVGDAAASYDPLSSLGIFKALRTGLLGGYAAFDALAGKDDWALKYAHVLEVDHAAYRAKHAEYHAMEDRWPRSPFWARRRRHAEQTAS